MDKNKACEVLSNIEFSLRYHLDELTEMKRNISSGDMADVRVAMTGLKIMARKAPSHIVEALIEAILTLKEYSDGKE